MKKIFILAIASLLCACSSDSAAPETDSEILVNGTEFVPADYAREWPKPIQTYSGHENNLNVRTFSITDYQAVGQVPTAILISVHYLSGIDGTYSFSGSEWLTNHFAKGFYNPGQETVDYNFDSGNVTVKSLGNNYYKLTFDNIHGLFAPLSDEVIVSGHYNGTFAPQ